MTACVPSWGGWLNPPAAHAGVVPWCSRGTLARSLAGGRLDRPDPAVWSERAVRAASLLAVPVSLTGHFLTWRLLPTCPGRAG